MFISDRMPAKRKQGVVGQPSRSSQRIPNNRNERANPSQTMDTTGDSFVVPGPSRLRSARINQRNPSDSVRINDTVTSQSAMLMMTQTQNTTALQDGLSNVRHIDSNNTIALCMSTCNMTTAKRPLR